MSQRGKPVPARAGRSLDGQPAPPAADPWIRVGRISRVQVYPLKSAAAPPAGAVALEAAGAVGDRWFVVTDPDGAPVTAEHAPRLRGVVALLAMDGGLVLQIPGFVGALRGDRADDALSDLLDRPVRIEPAVRSASRLDAPVHLVSVQALDAARRGEHAAADCACSLDEPRANLLVDLAGSFTDEGDPAEREAVGEPPAEAGRFEAALVGRRLRIGSAELSVTRTPGHCLGAYAEVLVAGSVRPGDTVEMLELPEEVRRGDVQPEVAEPPTAVIDLRDGEPVAAGATAGAGRRGRRHGAAG